MISIWTLALTTTFNVNWVWWELLLERSYCLVTEIEDRKQEDFYVEEALRACGYPKWTFNKVRRQIESKRDKKTKKQRDSSQRPMVVISHVENVSETVARIIKNHNVPVAMKPYKTLKSVLVHPKDKQKKEDLTECVYKVHCANCDKTYIGETGRTFGLRLQEHRTEMESKTGRTFTKSLRASSLTEHNKSTLTDHATQESHVINWSQATVIDREPERFTRRIKEATHTRNGRTTGHEPRWGQLYTNWATHTTAFLTRRLPVVSRTGRTEYQLLLLWRPLIEDVKTSSFR